MSSADNHVNVQQGASQGARSVELDNKPNNNANNNNDNNNNNNNAAPSQDSSKQAPAAPAPQGKYVPPALRNRVSNERSGSRDRPHSRSSEDGVAAPAPFGAPRAGGRRWGSGGDDYRRGGGGGRGWGGDDYRRGGGRGGRGGRGAADGPPFARDEKLELELFGRPKTGINFDQYDNIPVEVSGNDAPDPIEDFKSSDLPEVLKANIALSGYDKPTPVQKHAIPMSLAGRDVMACAQTGSGKTAAFLFPCIAALLMDKNNPQADESRGGGPAQGQRGYGHRRRCMPTALVLAPTRELATQIHNEANKFTYRTGFRSVVVYGGQPVYEQQRQLDRGCDILVATPGRLVDFMERGFVRLCNIRFLIFDEADRMLDMGFEPQIRDIVERSDMPGKETRQTLMFSATFPREIQMLARDFLSDYIFLAVGRVGSTTENITQVMVDCDRHDKRNQLMDVLLQQKGLTLIFVDTKRSADALEDFLIQEGVEAISIHGDRTQSEREFALNAFKSGRCPVLVATDVASRGLDIPSVTCVVNYDLPNTIDDYVHRIGRTGRAGRTGTAVAFVSERSHNILNELLELLRESNQEVPKWFEDLCRNVRGRRGGGGGGYRRGPVRDFRREGGGAGAAGGAGGGFGRRGGAGGDRAPMGGGASGGAPRGGGGGWGSGGGRFGGGWGSGGGRFGGGSQW